MPSIFQYLTVAEYTSRDLSVSAVTNSGLAESHISEAERWIDAYCRGWPCFYPELQGEVTAVNGATLTASVFGEEHPDYWAVGGLYVEVYSGGAAGQSAVITASSGNVVTASGLAGLAVGDRFMLRQRSVFPRERDYNGEMPYIPESVKHATALQVAYQVAKGCEAFGLWDSDTITNAGADLISETYGTGYGYQRNASASLTPSAQMLGPQTRLALRRFRGKIGSIMTRLRRRTR